MLNIIMTKSKWASPPEFRKILCTDLVGELLGTLHTQVFRKIKQ